MGLMIATQATTIGKILRQPGIVSVPLYQRDYSWTKEEVTELWNDLVQAISETGRDHFLGAVVLTDPDGEVSQIIDGQQRFATVSILLAALRDLLASLGDKRHTSLVPFLGEQDVETMQIEPKLRLNENNDEFFRDYIVSEDADSKERLRGRKVGTKSNRLIRNAYNMLYELLRDYVKDENSRALRVKAIVKAVDHQLKLILITVDNDSSAFLIFETLNQRGLELSIADLLKNYIFSKSGTKIEVIKTVWDNMSRSLGDEEVTTYLRHYWLSTREVIREKELYKAITSEFRQPTAVVAFAKQLEASAEIYGGLTEETASLWKNRFTVHARNKVVAELEQINLCGITQCFPVLLAAVEATPKIAPDIFRLMMVFTFRYSVIGSQGTGNLEKAYSDTALMLRKKKPDSAAAVFESLKSLYPTDEQFEEWFSEKQIRNSAITRYILRCLEDGGYKRGVTITNISTAAVSLEHILPKTFALPWKGEFVSAPDAAEFVYRLGNMTLLEPDLNTDVGNGAFKSKRDAAYSKSKIKNTKILAKLGGWSPDAVVKRQRDMAKKAVTIWRFA